MSLPMSGDTAGRTQFEHLPALIASYFSCSIDSADPQGDIPAPEAIAMYLYDNRQRKLSLQTQMGLQKDKEALTDMIVRLLCHGH